MNIQPKIAESIELIRRAEKLALALNPQDGFFVGFSGGKDSQVLLELVKMSGVKYKAYYSVTTNDPPENVYYIRNNYPEVQFIHPKENFFKLVEKNGLPLRITRFCCEQLKEQGGVGNVVLTGVRAEESKKRAKYNDVEIKSKRREHAENTQRTRREHAENTLSRIEENEHKCIKGKDKIMVYPLLHWKTSQIWQFIRDFDLPINPCYNSVGRVGCMFCPYAKRKQIMQYALKYPKFKKLLLKSLDKYITEKTEYKFNAEQYYKIWLSNKSVEDYLLLENQLTLF